MKKRTVVSSETSVHIFTKYTASHPTKRNHHIYSRINFMKSPASEAGNLYQAYTDVTSRLFVDQCVSAIKEMEVTEVRRP